MSLLAVEYLQHLGLSLIFMLLVLGTIAAAAWRINVHWDGKEYYPFLTFQGKVYRWDETMKLWCVGEVTFKEGGSDASTSDDVVYTSYQDCGDG